MNKDKYLIFLASGGMTHMLHLLSGAIECARRNGRVVIPMTKQHRAFAVEFSTVFDVCDEVINCDPQANALARAAWVPLNESFPKTIDEAKLKFDRDEQGKGYYFLSGVDSYKQNLKYLMNPEIQGESTNTWLCCGYYVNTAMLHALCSIRLNAKIVDKAVKLRSSIPDDAIACHFRNTDYKNDIVEFIESVKAAAEIGNTKNIFIATDDISSIPEFKKLLNEFTIYCNPGLKYNVKVGNDLNLHFVSDERLAECGMTKLDQHTEFFSDVYCLSTLSAFVPSPRSGIGEMVHWFRKSSKLLNWFYQTTPSEGISVGDVIKDVKYSHIKNYVKSKEYMTLPLNGEYSNIAFGKKYITSSAYKGVTQSGVLVPTRPYSFHTNLEDKPFILVDLYSPHIISKIVIINRTNGCYDRAKNLNIKFFNELDLCNPNQYLEVCDNKDFLNGDNLSLEISVPKYIAKYVMIESTIKTALHFSDLQIWGTPSCI